MILMSREEVIAEIDKINAYIKNCSWMDFEFCQMSFVQITLAGTIDEGSNEYAIDIEFEQPFFVSSLFLWGTDTSRPLIQLATEEEERELEAIFHLGLGQNPSNYVFKIQAEHYGQTPTIIIAKRVTCKINREDPFRKQRGASQ